VSLRALSESSCVHSRNARNCEARTLVAAGSYVTPGLRESRCAEVERKKLSAAQVAQHHNKAQLCPSLVLRRMVWK
jgi:hypothetical protein